MQWEHSTALPINVVEWSWLIIVSAVEWRAARAFIMRVIDYWYIQTLQSIHASISLTACSCARRDPFIHCIKPTHRHLFLEVTTPLYAELLQCWCAEIRTFFCQNDDNITNGQTCWYDTMRYDTRCYFNVRSKATISRRFTYKMAANEGGHRYETKLRHCRSVLSILNLTWSFLVSYE